ncbi:hypothetical protein A2110_01480 [Candidatus Jorgensenbacteria bacterium GWA1_54_12]|uniref:PD-(D/E)XK endonuclease-like domain-containing protein n=1 Tax=Candidatus Jorgensenbacteria bacterium GWA1_54_12 TaxID=1798468 RepID=A0A1F6BLG9_9BACT|nr:MAG: hypothetical protein A2110_01480 [Candidatus Jorgensenbacteria bacterium GWA1_54_12]
MSRFYNPRRSKNIFTPDSREPFRLSRSRLEVFMACPRCFYLDRRVGVDRPPGFPLSLNSAVDKLLKKEFDIHRAQKTAHPLMERYGVDAVPFEHPALPQWRENFVGIEYHEPRTNFVVAGAVDDVWVSPVGELIVVDYKATAKTGDISIDADWQISYKRQMEVYQWLLRRNGFTVSSRGYFVYANGDADKRAFDGKLEFSIQLIPYDGNDAWILDALVAAHDCLAAPVPPPAGRECDYCGYYEARREAEDRYAH